MDRGEVTGLVSLLNVVRKCCVVLIPITKKPFCCRPTQDINISFD